MTSMHPLEKTIRDADGLVLIGDSSENRFPGYSYNAYTEIGKRFYCLDLGGLSESRGPTAGGKVYTSVEELPEDRGDLAVIWVKPRTATRAVEVAHAACPRRPRRHLGQTENGDAGGRGRPRRLLSTGVVQLRHRPPRRRRQGQRAGDGSRRDRPLPGLLSCGQTEGVLGSYPAGEGHRFIPAPAAS